MVLKISDIGQKKFPILLPFHDGSTPFESWSFDLDFELYKILRYISRYQAHRCVLSALSVVRYCLQSGGEEETQENLVVKGIRGVMRSGKILDIATGAYVLTGIIYMSAETLSEGQL